MVFGSVDIPFYCSIPLTCLLSWVVISLVSVAICFIERHLWETKIIIRINTAKQRCALRALEGRPAVRAEVKSCCGSSSAEPPSNQNFKDVSLAAGNGMWEVGWELDSPCGDKVAKSAFGWWQWYPFEGVRRECDDLCFSLKTSD